MAISTFILFLVPILSVTTSAEPGPELEINFIGSNGIVVLITNNGDEAAIDIKCSLYVKGGMLGLINKTGLGTINSLEVGEEGTGAQVYLFGFGLVKITAIAEAANAQRVEKTVNGFVILFFVIIFG